MRYVLDASAALCWVLPRPNSGKALQLRTDYQNAVHETDRSDRLLRRGRECAHEGGAAEADPSR